MENEQTTTVTEQVDNNQYIQAINELKEKTVDKEKYIKLQQENKKLLDSIVNGTEIDLGKQTEKKTIKELRDDYFKPDQSNLEFVKNTLALRQAIIDSGKSDPFLPIGNKIIPTEEDIATATRVANILQECVDYADGDSTVFTNELQRRTVDIPMPRRK